MKLYDASQIRAWDAYTIAHEPIPSLDLMERAARACFDWIFSRFDGPLYIFCGRGNNGGDGLALARLLLVSGMPVKVYILEFGHLGTEDFQVNLQRLHGLTPEIHFIQSSSAFPSLEPSAIVVDALLGTGLNRPLEGLTAELVGYLNGAGRQIIAIDLPSGLRTDEPTPAAGTARPGPGDVVRAAFTLTLGTWKLALMMAENAPFIGEVHILPIGLSPDYEAPSSLFVTGLPEARSYYRPRSAFSNKGNFGHALLAAGAPGKMGACVLASRACLRSGVGLLTDLVPPAGLDIIQVSVPEAMALTDLASVDASVYKAFGIGPGLGMGALDVVRRLLEIAAFPVVIDADALNLISAHPSLWEKVPPHSILTPHPKEFERLFGAAPNDFARMRQALDQAVSRGCIIVLKGHRTLVAFPDGTGHFNTTGNAGMATGGSGDVLTGILTGLLTQGYPPRDAAILGVYLHGLAGDLGLRDQSMESLLASGIAEGLGAAYKYLAGESL